MCKAASTIDAATRSRISASPDLAADRTLARAGPAAPAGQLDHEQRDGGELQPRDRRTHRWQGPSPVPLLVLSRIRPHRARAAPDCGTPRGPVVGWSGSQWLMVSQVDGDTFVGGFHGDRGLASASRRLAAAPVLAVAAAGDGPWSTSGTGMPWHSPLSGLPEAKYA